ncbi:MAG TPA: hypothetical protein VFC39_21765 [Acidobacteriaceae bacterium]|nr:hypothetical protein [Acidobacteriaceae bacterium]
MPRKSLAKPILIAGLVAGVLDISDALLFYGLHSHVPPVRLLQGIAAGLIGKSSFSDGLSTAALGLAMHFSIATFWAAVFIIAARSLPVLRRHAAASGVVYGLIVYAVMNYLVLPHTHARPLPTAASITVLNGVCAIVFCVGLPIALINRRCA